MLSTLPSGGRVLDLQDVVDAYDDPEVSWAITTTGRLHHLSRSSGTTHVATLCGGLGRTSAEPAHPHAVCRRCLDARANRPAPPRRPRPVRAYISKTDRERDESERSHRLDQCNRLLSMYSARWLAAQGDLVWLKGTERPNVDPVAAEDAKTSCADVNELWRYVFLGEES